MTRKKVEAEIVWTVNGTEQEEELVYHNLMAFLYGIAINNPYFKNIKVEWEIVNIE